ncbi:hypothetical protein DFH06DRAFT_1075074 [Mycena polygramma]|nr:hypothetical protein DFH06DRAFT_1075074 [Mycena polygramma]
MSFRRSTSFALGSLPDRLPQYQNQNTLVNKDGRLRFAAVSRRALALPPELLGEIFIHCLPVTVYRLADIPVIPSPNDAPLVLCGVCRYWRQIALSTPGLWASIFLDADFAYSDKGAEYVDFCRRWISRARSTPLSFCLEAYVNDASVHSLLEILGSLSEQWRDIELTLGQDFPKTSSLPADGNYPVLERLSLDAPNSDLPISFCNAPLLRDVRFGIYTPQILIPWHQISSFWTNHIELFHFHQLLREAPNLVTGYFSIPSYHSLDLPDGVLPLTRLQELTLRGTYGDQVVHLMSTTLLAHLNTPALKTLTFGYPFRIGWDAPDIFLSSMSRASFELHTLVLCSIQTTPAALIHFLQAIPSLVHLKLQPPLLLNMKPIFAQLTGHREFLPKLESLHMIIMGHAPNVSPIVALDVVRMLFWRRVSFQVASLQSFRLVHECRNPFFEEAVKSNPVFKRLETGGMALYIGQKMQYSFVDSLM